MPITDLLSRVTDSTTGRPAVTSLGVGGKALGASSFTLADATNWTTASVHYFAIYEIDASGLKIQSSQTDWKGTLSGTTMSNLVLTGGTDKTYSQGAIVEVTPTARWAKDLYDNIRAHANQDGSLQTAAVQAALNIGSVPADYTPLANPPSSVVANGNRSYTLTFAGQDYSGVLSPGKRLRTTRTVAAPTQSTSLNGTNQYFSKTSPAGMTFTDDWSCGRWIKLSAYGNTTIESRFNGTSGWQFAVNSSGQLTMIGYNGGSANYRQITSYQSVPLNKWVFVSAQMDMSAYTVSATTCYTMIDGVDVPAFLAQGGTNPTALVQAGDYQIGALNGANFFSGKLGMGGIFSAKVTQVAWRSYMSQAFSGSETSLVSAHSFNNTLNDLNTTNANNLTANNGAVATNADSPFGGQASGAISSTLDYAIIQTVSYAASNTTVVCQVPEGCTIPTSGGVTAISHSGVKAPYGFPGQREKWKIASVYKNIVGQSTPVAGNWYNIIGQLNIPVGEWAVGYNVAYGQDRAAGNAVTAVTLSDATNTQLDQKYTSYLEGNNVTNLFGSNYLIEGMTMTSQANRYLNFNSLSASATNIYVRGDRAAFVIMAENAYL